jgi:hypothetical protein
LPKIEDEKSWLRRPELYKRVVEPHKKKKNPVICFKMLHHTHSHDVVCNNVLEEIYVVRNKVELLCSRTLEIYCPKVGDCQILVPAKVLHHSAVVSWYFFNKSCIGIVQPCTSSAGFSETNKKITVNDI